MKTRTYVHKPVVVKIEELPKQHSDDVDLWGVDYDEEIHHHSRVIRRETFEGLFEPYEKVAAREMNARAIHRKLCLQRRELKRLNRVVRVLKSRYLTLFGEIDRALGDDLPRKQSTSWQEGNKEGYKAGFAAGYDVAKGGKQ